MPKVFFITGCSTGIGFSYGQYVLSQGDYLAATSRDASKLPSFKGASSENYLALSMDVTSSDSIQSALNSALEKFKRIDVVCNNAGYGLCGTMESLSQEHIRTQMEVNFFGLVNVTRAAMEIMREKQKPSGGMIQQVTSIGGHRGVPLFSIYCASKWAVEGFTEAVSHEVKPEWGIKFNCIEPGGFRTEWTGTNMIFADPHPAYTHLNPKESMDKRHGTQQGDPDRGAAAMYKVATMKDPPLRIVLGSDAFSSIIDKIEKYDDNYRK